MGETYDYGCLMLNFDIKSNIWQGITTKLIEPNDIFHGDDVDSDFGIEKEAHVTLLYGLHHDKFNILDVTPMLKKFGSFPISTSKIGAFKTDDYDVLKFDIDSEVLHQINKYLTQNFEYTSTFPDYKPHATLAYLKPGTSDKYIKKLSEPYILPIGQYKYSAPDGTKTFFKV
jgi:2'-5' RNA ligase